MKFKNTKIGLIIATTSKNRNYKAISEIDFIKYVINSLLKIHNNNYVYNFYLGYDDDDEFYIKNKDDIVSYVHSLKKNWTIQFYKMENLTNNTSEIWNRLANIASKQNEYMYQLGDDIEFITPGWEDVFTKTLQKNDNLGVTGGLDINTDNANRNTITQGFFHRKHLDIFGYLYPKELKNWGSDNWLTHVYNSKPNTDIKIRNSSGHNPRYKPFYDEELYNKILEEGKRILNENHLK